MCAGICEVIGVLAIKHVTENKSWKSYLYIVITFGTSFSLLTYAMTEISMGTSYAIWTGIGTTGGTLLGMFYFGESREKRRIFCISVILLSAIGLKFFG